MWTYYSVVFKFPKTFALSQVLALVSAQGGVGQVQ